MFWEHPAVIARTTAPAIAAVNRPIFTFLLAFFAHGTFAIGTPCTPSEQPADVPEATGLIHDNVPPRIVPAVFRPGDSVTVAFETAVRFGELFFAFVALMPLYVMDERHNRKARMKSGDGISQPFRK